jgi:hypothetical protein
LEFNGKYEVSSNGKVRNAKSKIVLSPYRNRHGYLLVAIYFNGKSRGYSVHRLVAKTFVPNLQGKECVNHLDENKMNNNYLNLEWCTIKENNSYGTRNKRIGLHKKKQVVQIDKKTNEIIRTWDGIIDVERELGISHATVNNCCKGRQKTSGKFIWKYKQEAI